MTDPTNKPDDKRHLATRVIHGGQSPDPSTGAVMPPIFATSTFVQESPGVHKGLDYGRSHNPTRWALERCVADIESGSAAFAFASGLAAISAVLELLPAGSHIVAGDDMYGGTYRLFERVRRRSAGRRWRCCARRRGEDIVWPAACSDACCSRARQACRRTRRRVGS